MTTTWSDRTTYQGKRINQGTAQILRAANKMLRTARFGSERENVTMVQGGYNAGGVAASAGTHDGGGAFDLTPWNWQNRVRVFRLLGVAYWDRPALRYVWAHHNHGIVCGDGTASAGAKAQVTAYLPPRARNGLATNLPDPNWRPAGLPIYFHLDGDLRTRYCRTACHVYDSPSSVGKNLGPVPVGSELVPVAVVRAAGNYWFITADGRCGFEGNFSTTPPGTDPEPEPTPSPATSVDVRALAINVGADYVPGFNSRVAGLAKVRDTARASWVLTCESGNYEDGARLNRAYGWGGVRGSSFVLHGGSVPITTTVHLDTGKYEVLGEGMVITTPGTTHRWGTWVLDRHRASGVIAVKGVTHLQYLPIGPNDIRKYDREREGQLAAFLRQLHVVAEAARKRYGLRQVPVLVGGDMNGKRTDPYDGPGKAAAAYGYVDAATVAETHTGGNAALIDRWFVPYDTRVAEHAIYPTHGSTDHDYAVAISVTLTNT